MFDEEHDKFILEAYFRSGFLHENEWKYSIQSCHEQFLQNFPNFEVTYHNFSQHVSRVVHRFRNTGSVVKGKSTGRPSKLSEEVLHDVEERLEGSPHKSLRHLSRQTGLSYGTCQRATKKLHLHAYKISVVQELTPLDYGKRVEYCHWFLQNMNEDLLNLTFFTDEAWFHLSGYVNSQNYRTWSHDNPHTYTETSLHPLKVGVWIAMSRRRIIGPIFFYDTVTSERYVTLILRQYIDQLHDDELTRGYFQQDGATAHTSNVTLNFLKEYYDERIISKNHWPPRSPDLTPLDFYLFGYLKTKIYANRMHSLDELEEAITNAVRNITEDELRNVFQNMHTRVNKCIEANGGHFEHLL